MKMIIIAFALLATACVSTKLVKYDSERTPAQSGGAGPGGGDPHVVTATQFPDQKLLSSAIAHLVTSIKKTSYPVEITNKILSEIALLKDKNLFLYVPQVFSIGFSRHSGDYKTLYSHGAFTTFAPGEPIYFSRKVEKYSVEELAAVIAQEVPHHTLPGKFRYDEQFVNRLGTALVKGETDTSIIKELRTYGLLEDVRIDFMQKLCNEEGLKGAAEIVKAQFLKSMDGRLSLDERKDFGNLGSELRLILKTAAFSKNQYCNK